MNTQKYMTKLSDGFAVGGLDDTLRALNEGHVERLLMCANVAANPGWQCPDCAALFAGMDSKPESCTYCHSRRIHMADLKSQMIARAYQVGCCIEIMSRCPDLEPFGGVGALLSQKHAGRYMHQTA